MTYKPQFNAFIRRQNPETLKWENANIAELPDAEFKAIMVDFLCRAGFLVGIKTEIDEESNDNR